ncbi:MAG: hypothetical protein L3J83_07145 [Proteobacteria bacterium]|nr:hypothetical protein [Pseudomonadota bacterium]
MPNKLTIKNKAKPLLEILFFIFSSSAMSAMPEAPEPSENPITENKRILGKILFWDEQLSSDDTVACGTCHIVSNAGTDPRPATHPGPDGTLGTDDDVIGSMGIAHYDENMQPIDNEIFGFQPQITGRNTPSFLNAMYADDLFWDGRARSQFLNPQNPEIVSIVSGGALESQAVGPILSSVEMAKENRSWDDVITKLISVSPLALASNIPTDMKQAVANNSNYPDLFNLAFGDSDITAERIGMAIATYERTLVSDQTPWDLYMAGDTAAMTADQIAGWDFFQNGDGGMGMVNCAMCHTPPLFTDNKFYNIGLRPAQEDAGRMDVTNNSDDFGRFKTPGLRNIGLKSAMMHVGWITDTMDSIDFYNAGTSDVTSPHIQFTENQSGLPTGNPNAPMQPPYTMASLEVDSEENQAKVADFIDNALTDPRVASETFPFDRPLLNTEVTHPINSGLNGAWYNPNTPGQGMLMEVLPDSNKVFIGWFTYDTTTPDDNLLNTVGSTDHRWLTGLGEINMQEKSITFDVNVTSDGLFDSNQPVATSDAVGSVTIGFSSCSAADVDYNLLNNTINGSFPMIRITAENDQLCEQLLTGNIANVQKTQTIKEDTKADATMHINSGLNGAWFNTDTSGQGFLIEVLPETKRVFVAWFTYDTNLPSSNTTAVIGDAGHRWLTGIGDIDDSNNSVVIDINLTSGGLFDNSQTVTTSETMTYGNLTLSFDDCSNAKVEYNLSSLNLAGTIPLERISNENIPLCEQLLK